MLLPPIRWMPGAIFMTESSHPASWPAAPHGRFWSARPDGGQLVADGGDVVNERVHVGQLGVGIDEAGPDRQLALDDRRRWYRAGGAAQPQEDLGVDGVAGGVAEAGDGQLRLEQQFQVRMLAGPAGPRGGRTRR